MLLNVFEELKNFPTLQYYEQVNNKLKTWSWTFSIPKSTKQSSELLTNSPIYITPEYVQTKVFLGISTFAKTPYPNFVYLI